MLTYADKNITAIAWCPIDTSVIAQATNDKVFIIWDINTETVKYRTQLESHVFAAEWSPNDPNIIYLIQSNGEFKIMNLATKSLQSVEISHLNARPCVLKVHPSRADIISIGLMDGRIFFLKATTQESFVFNAHEDLSEDEVITPGMTPPGRRIEDIAWDPQEDNFLVSFADKSMILATFQGFSPDTRLVRQYEPQ